MTRYEATPLVQRFWARVSKTATCWLWTGAPTSAGYGVIADADGRRLRAHRLSWILHHGPIPAGLGVLHTCDVRLCVNPAHLFLGTQADNMHDASVKGRVWHARPTHCKHGHAFTEANTLHRRDGSRDCRTCARAATARWRTRQQRS